MKHWKALTLVQESGASAAEADLRNRIIDLFQRYQLAPADCENWQPDDGDWQRVAIALAISTDDPAFRIKVPETDPADVRQDKFWDRHRLIYNFIRSGTPGPAYGKRPYSLPPALILRDGGGLTVKDAAVAAKAFMEREKAGGRFSGSIPAANTMAKEYSRREREIKNGKFAAAVPRRPVAVERFLLWQQLLEPLYRLAASVTRQTIFTNAQKLEEACAGTLDMAALEMVIDAASRRLAEIKADILR